MILFHKKYNVEIKKITFKKKRKFSNDFIYIPIQYDKKDLIIQTPLLFIPFGINKYSTTSTKKYLDLSFQNNDCPYCRSKHNYLPIVPGLKKFNPKINEYDINKIDLLNKKCEMVLKKGKNKGNQCSKNCKLGFNYCTIHQKQFIKKSE